MLHVRHTDAGAPASSRGQPDFFKTFFPYIYVVNYTTFWNIVRANKRMHCSPASPPSTPPRVHRLRLARDQVKAPLAPLIRREILRPRNCEPSVGFADLPEFGSSFSHRFLTNVANDIVNHSARTTSSNVAANDDSARFQSSQELLVPSKENFGNRDEERKRKSTNIEEYVNTLSRSNLHRSTFQDALQPTPDESLNFLVRKVMRRGVANR